jgi:UDP-N-acetylmuramyl pentapeptide phosphotransferase/UDP-N-acetylglucosamine-1-phosphate transferase
MDIFLILNESIAVILSFFLSFGLIFWANRRFGTRSFQDNATLRSLHIGVTPKVGGLGLLPSVSLALITYNLMEPMMDSQRNLLLNQWLLPLIWLAPAYLIFIVCLLSDQTQTEFPALTRFTVFSIASLVSVGIWLYLSSAGLLEFVGAALPNARAANPMILLLGFAGFVALSTLAFTNFYNFMDGMDGLGGSMGLIGFASLGSIALQAHSTSQLGITSLILSASCLGFLYWNWPKAKVFMGDTGSTFLGFSAAVLGWMGTLEGLWQWSIPFLVFFPFWFDASTTLLRRFLRGEAVWRAHREHFYQRAILSLDSLEMSKRHQKVLFPAIALMLVSSSVALSQHQNVLGLSSDQPWGGLAILSVIHGSVALWVERRYRASLSRNLV